MEHKSKINGKPLNAQKADIFDMQNLLAEKEEQGGKSCAMLQFVPKLQNSMISTISMRGRPLDKGSKGTGMLRHYGIRWNGKRKIENGKLLTNCHSEVLRTYYSSKLVVSNTNSKETFTPEESSLLLTFIPSPSRRGQGEVLTFNQGGLLC